MKDITKKYTNGEVTIVWKPNQCIHSTLCFKGLGQVFDPRRRPWVTPEQATTQQIVEQIKKCPSGALSYYMNSETEATELKVEAETIVETSPNGPLLVYGNVAIKDGRGSLTRKNNVTAFCRCGASGNKPFCDGSHKKIGFEG
ncbi:MAG: (4Fe-4S)-binding protein [Cyclobacteriaceae bacterium]|nr:(4Fe-4S)-binding protein [Cyclobacteriaceae bacterium]